MHSLRRLAGLAPLAALVACSGFAKLRHTLGELQTLQAGMVRDFGEPNVALNESGATLTVMFVNSPLGGLPETQRADTARAVAAYVRDHFTGYATLQDIRIGFSSQAGAAGFSMSRSEIPYVYTTADLGPPANVAPKDSVRAPATRPARSVPDHVR